MNAADKTHTHFYILNAVIREGIVLPMALSKDLKEDKEHIMQIFGERIFQAEITANAMT